MMIQKASQSPIDNPRKSDNKLLRTSTCKTLPLGLAMSNEYQFGESTFLLISFKWDSFSA